MFKKIMPQYSKFTEYSIYLFLLLIVLDIVSTYIGLEYFNAYEANEKTAYLFGIFGILLPSALKIITALILCYIIKNVWRKSEFFLSHKNGWLNSIGILSSLNIMFVILSLNVVYLIVVVHNINIIYNYI